MSYRLLAKIYKPVFSQVNYFPSVKVLPSIGMRLLINRRGQAQSLRQFKIMLYP
ncbi:MAG: hypothetical protein ACI9CE_001224 [Flavobacterium sp.]|jgi:hypothetical protein